MARLLSITTGRRSGNASAARATERSAAANGDAGVAALSAQYYRRWQPAAAEERVLVDLLIAADWRLRRLQAERQSSAPEPA